MLFNFNLYPTYSSKSLGQNTKLPFNLFRKDIFNLEELFEKGYQDTAMYGKQTLDTLFLHTEKLKID